MAAENVLVRQLRAANPEALRQVFDRYAPRVYAFAVGYLKQPRLAEDAVRHVFVGLWDKRWTLDDDQPLDGYLFTLAYHHVLATFRQQHGRCLTHEVLHRLTTRSESPDDERHLALAWERLYQQAVGQLPLRQRRILLLSRDEGLSHQRIADLLRVPEATVADELARALKKVSRHFEQTN